MRSPAASDPSLSCPGVPPMAQDGQARRVLAATSVSYVIVILDTSIVNVALNNLSMAFGAGIASLQWVMNAYTLMFASLLLTGGALGDRWGARRVYLAGLGLFLLASSACAMAATLPVLIGARALQGMGAALLVPCSLKLIHQACPAAAQRARAIGIWAGLGGIAMAAGPLAGGLLIHWLDWRALFLVNVPICLAGMAMAWGIARDPAQAEAPRSPGRLDLAGLACGVVALGATIGVLIEGRVLGWTSAPMLAGAALCVTAWAVLLRVETRHPTPMLPPRLFRDGLFSASVHVSLVSAFAFYGLLFVISLYYQQARGYTPLHAGLVLLPMTAMVGVGNMSASPLAARHGRKWPMIAALAGYAGGAAGLGLGLALANAALTVPSLLVIGLAAGVITPLATAPALETVSPQGAGVAAAVVNTGRQTGAALGVAIFGTVLGAVPPIESGMRAALGLVVAASAATIPVWWRALRPGARGPREGLS
ncbi:MFS transporter [Achromobacter aloeverae]